MKLNFTRSTSLLACLSLAGILTLAVPTLAQNSPNNTTGGATQPGPDKTGVGPRGSKVGPSTDPGLAGRGPTSSSASQTGVGSRGSKVAPSTEPPANNQR
jgi:hypothetical protein